MACSMHVMQLRHINSPACILKAGGTFVEGQKIIQVKCDVSAVLDDRVIAV